MSFNLSEITCSGRHDEEGILGLRYAKKHVPLLMALRTNPDLIIAARFSLANILAHSGVGITYHNGEMQLRLFDHDDDPSPRNHRDEILKELLYQLLLFNTAGDFHEGGIRQGSVAQMINQMIARHTALIEGGKKVEAIKLEMVSMKHILACLQTLVKEDYLENDEISQVIRLYRLLKLSPQDGNTPLE